MSTLLGGAIASSPVASEPIAASTPVLDGTAAGYAHCYSALLGDVVVISPDRRVIVPTEQRTVFISKDQSMFLQWPMKDPGDSKDFSADWTKWLAPGDYIVSSKWSAPSVLSVTVSAFTNTVTTAWLSGGGPSTQTSLVDVQNTITTAQGRTVVKTVQLPIGPN